MSLATFFILLSLKYRDKGGISSNLTLIFLQVFQHRRNIIVKFLVIPLLLMEKLSSSCQINTDLLYTQSSAGAKLQ